MLDINKFTIRLIGPEETYAVRQPVLRDGRPIEDCMFDGDKDDTTFHLGLFNEQKLLAVASFMKNPNDLFKEKDQYQLRGMAVLKTYQGKGLGNKILNYAEAILSNKGVTIIWCNAREIAVNFYKKNGFIMVGQPFIIPRIGLHYIMFKTIAA